MKAPRIGKFGKAYILASVATLAVAWWLWSTRRPGLALLVLEVSPAPCPPGLPC